MAGEIVPRYEVYKVRHVKHGVGECGDSFECSVFEDDSCGGVARRIATSAGDIDGLSNNLMQYRASVNWSELENLSKSRIMKRGKGFTDVHVPLSGEEWMKLAVELCRW